MARSSRRLRRFGMLPTLAVLIAAAIASEAGGAQRQRPAPRRGLTQGVSRAAAQELANDIRNAVRAEALGTHRAQERRLQQLARRLAPYLDKAVAAAQQTRGWSSYAREADQQARALRAGAPSGNVRTRDLRPVPSALLERHPDVRDAAGAAIDIGDFSGDVRDFFGEPVRPVDPENPNLYWIGDRPTGAAPPPPPASTTGDAPGRLTLMLEPPYSGPVIDEEISSDVPWSFPLSLPYAQRGEINVRGLILGPPAPFAASMSARALVGEYFTVPPGYRWMVVTAHTSIAYEHINAASVAFNCVFGGIGTIGARDEQMQIYLSGPVDKDLKWPLQHYQALIPLPTAPCLPVEEIEGLSTPFDLGVEAAAPTAGGEFMVMAGSSLDYWVAGIGSSVSGQIEGTVDRFEIELYPQLPPVMTGTAGRR